MTMDLISGLAVIASVFMLACALVAVVSRRPAGEPGYSGGLDAVGLASRVLATLVIVFFITTADLLLIAQQVSLALGTFVVGILLVVVLYLEPSMKAGRGPAEEGKEGWRR